MPKTLIPANAISVPVPSRRAFMANGASLIVSALVPPGAQAAPHRGNDAALVELERQFEVALVAHQNAQRHYNECETRFFETCPDPPSLLTREGPLAKALSNDWSWLSVRDLRWLLQDKRKRRLWKDAQAALPVAKSYEAKVRRLKRTIGLAVAENAQHKAADALDDLSWRIAAVPADSLVGLAVKARVLRRWGAPGWWEDAGTAEYLATQLVDDVLRLNVKIAV